MHTADSKVLWQWQVEHTSLLSNSKDNVFVGINLYTDDEASFSGAGINQRASEIASCCGIALQVSLNQTPPTCIHIVCSIVAKA